MVKLDKSEYDDTAWGRRESRESNFSRTSGNDEYVPCNRSDNVVVPTASGAQTSTTQNIHTGATQSHDGYAENNVVHCSSVGSSGAVSANYVAQNGGTRQRWFDTATVPSVELSSSVGQEGITNTSARPSDNDIHGATAKPIFPISSDLYHHYITTSFDIGGTNTAGCSESDAFCPTDNEDNHLSSPSVSDLGVLLPRTSEHSEETVSSIPLKERRLSKLQNDIRLGFPPTCDFGHKVCFRLQSSPIWPVDKESIIKEYCMKRVGCVQDSTAGTFLGTGWRVGNKYIATCLHCVVGYLRKSNDKTLLSGDLRVRFDDPASLGDSCYKIHQELPFVNTENDIAVLKMSGNCAFPPAFDNFDLSSEERGEIPLYNVGYQCDGHGKPPFLVMDQAVVLKSPCDEEFTQLNKQMATTYDDKVGYAGLNRDGNFCLWSSIVDGGSGGVCVYPDDERNNCKVYGMYQNGYPKHYYSTNSFAEKEAMRPCLKIETAISMAKFFDVVSLGTDMK